MNGAGRTHKVVSAGHWYSPDRQTRLLSFLFELPYRPLNVVGTFVAIENDEWDIAPLIPHRFVENCNFTNNIYNRLEWNVSNRIVPVDTCSKVNLCEQLVKRDPSERWALDWSRDLVDEAVAVLLVKIFVWIVLCKPVGKSWTSLFGSK